MTRTFVLALAALLLPACQGAKDSDNFKKATGASAKKGPATASSQKAQVKNGDGTPAPTSQPAAAAASQPTAGQMPPGHPPTETPASQPASQPTSQPAGGGVIRGTISIEPGLIDHVKAGSYLYVISRRAGERMPLAVKKIPIPSGKVFPVEYTMTSADQMMRGMPFTGQVDVDARVDQDGDAISKQPGDITGKAEGAHSIGGGPVDFTLNTKL